MKRLAHAVALLAAAITLTACTSSGPDDSAGSFNDAGDMGHGDTTGEMPGMMDAEAMDELEQADGENEEAVTLAGKVETDQAAEISLMQELLGK